MIGSARTVPSEDVVTALLGHVRLEPGAPAIRQGDRVVTRAELACAAADQAAAVDRSCGDSELVVLPWRRDPETVARALGVLWSGRGYVPVTDDDATAATVAAVGGVAAPADPVRWSSDVDAAGTPSPAHPRSAAYVVLTSGTTGSPKAVVVERGQLADYCAFLVDAGICTPETDMPAISAPGFDAVVKQLWGRIVAGAVVDLPSGTDVVDHIERAVRAAAVSATPLIVNTVPAVWSHALAGISGTDAALTVILGGDTLDADLIARTRAAVPAARLINFYGPSENTATTTWHVVTDDDADPIPLGQPVPGAVVTVLDDGLRPVDDGVVGLIHVAGSTVARGYVGDPRRTASAFLPAPSEAGLAPGTRMYATGDIGWIENGRLMHSGRVADHVKIAGVRADLRALRDDLVTVGGVEDAAVVAVHDASAEAGRLVAVVAPGTTASVDAARDRIRTAWRPEFAGAGVVGVEHMPRTQSGKHDGAAIRLLAASSATTPRARETHDRGPLHPVISAIWSGVLPDADVDRSTSLADLGADSLKRLKLVALYRRVIGVEVTLDDVVARHRAGEHEDLVVDRVGRDRLDELADAVAGAS